jgi:hypothetical protein
MPNQCRKGIRGILPHNVTGIPGNLVRVGSSSVEDAGGYQKREGWQRGTKAKGRKHFRSLPSLQEEKITARV